MKPRVLVDVDGVLADFVGHTFATLTALGGPERRHENVVQWDILDVVPPEFKEGLNQQWHSKGWCQTIPELPGAGRAVRELQSVADLHILTAAFPAPYWHHERLEWLYHRVGVKGRDVTFSCRKEFVYGDVFVDDKTEHVVAWAERHPTGRAFLWAQPWNNECAPVPENVTRTRSWDLVIEAARHRLLSRAPWATTGAEVHP
jgi:5'(3')-deoxyribonucleotidase